MLTCGQIKKEIILNTNNNSKIRAQLVVGLILVMTALSAMAGPLAPWLTQVGISESILSTGKWGYGVKVGVVDTGINAASPFFVPEQVSVKMSGCSAVSFVCSNGVMDDNGHGTAVAAIIGGNLPSAYTTSRAGYITIAGSQVSVAPSVNIVAEKVLKADGSGSAVDVANGIRKAAMDGVSVINVSITYGNAAEIVSSINYATSRGAIVVWAGGNSGVDLLSGANTVGLTPTAISRLVFVGSVDANNNKSAFSNTPGTGSLVSGSSKTGETQVGYSNRWLVAPGEAILAPLSPTGATWGHWSGTSMSAPIVSGSIALLQSAWPILKTKASAADLLLETATDLGVVGTDATYGVGLLNMDKAFKPVGPLTVTTTSGRRVEVGAVTGSMVSSRAFGVLTGVKSKLSSYTAFDDYGRNFTVDLTKTLISPSSRATINALPLNSRVKPVALKLADGAVASAWVEDSENPTAHLGEPFYVEGLVEKGTSMYMALSLKDGSSYSIASGYGSQYGYAQSLYGDSVDAGQVSQLSATGISTLTDGGLSASYGIALAEKTRVALGISASAPEAQGESFNSRSSSDVTLGISQKLGEDLTGSLSVGVVSEKNGLLGSNYSKNSLVGFGESNSSIHYDVSAVYALNKDLSMMVTAGASITKGGAGSGMVAGISDIVSHTYGASLAKKNLFEKEDQLTLSVVQPMRVSAGSAGVVMSSVDDLGYEVRRVDWVPLAPSGRELDYKLGYTASLGLNKTLSANAEYRKDAMNIAGNSAYGVGASFKLKF